MKKNTGALVLAILAAISGLIGALMWVACAATCANVGNALAGAGGTATGYTIGFAVLGIGGSVFTLIGGIRAYGFNSGRAALSVIGLLMQIGNVILQCVSIGGFSFTLSLMTLVAILLAFIEAILSAKKE